MTRKNRERYSCLTKEAKETHSYSVENNRNAEESGNWCALKHLHWMKDLEV